MKRPRSGRPRKDNPQPGPEPVLRLHLYIRRLTREHGVSWADIARAVLEDEQGALARALGLNPDPSRFDAARRKICGQFGGRRIIPPQNLVKIAIDCCRLGDQEAIAHRDCCERLYQEAVDGRDGPKVRSDEVYVELAVPSRHGSAPATEPMAAMLAGPESPATVDEGDPAALESTDTPVRCGPWTAAVAASSSGLAADEVSSVVRDPLLDPHTCEPGPQPPAQPATEPRPNPLTSDNPGTRQASAPGHAPLITVAFVALPAEPTLQPASVPSGRLGAAAPPRRRRLQVACIVAVIGLAFLGGILTRDQRSSPQGGATVGAPPASVIDNGSTRIDCGHGEVAARDLWLRDEYGGPLSELVHGQNVIIHDRPNPARLPYRLVTADDGRTGWADTRYIRPRCT